MPDLKDINNVYMIAAFLVPGLIITYVRAQFITGRMEKTSESFLAYLSLTVIYYGFSLPVIFFILNQPLGWIRSALWLLLIIAGPSAFGLLLGIAAQHQWLRWVASKLHLRIVHGTPTSWDWRFAQCSSEQFIMVTLADGSTVAGIFGTNSFASSDPGERDLYIQEILDVADDGRWTYKTELTGIFIAAKEIRFVEIKGEI